MYEPVGKIKKKHKLSQTDSGDSCYSFSIKKKYVVKAHQRRLSSPLAACGNKDNVN